MKSSHATFAKNRGWKLLAILGLAVPLAAQSGPSEVHTVSPAGLGQSPDQAVGEILTKPSIAYHDSLRLLTRGGAPFNLTIGGVANDDSTANDVMYLGFNTADRGELLDKAEPALALALESNFLWQGSRYLEFHLQQRDIRDGTYRPFSFWSSRDFPAKAMAWTYQISSNESGYFTILAAGGQKTLYSFLGEGHVYFEIENTTLHLNGANPTISNKMAGGNINYTVTGGGTHNFTGSFNAINSIGDIKTAGSAYISSATDFRLGNNGFTRVAKGDGGGGFIGGYNVTYTDHPTNDSDGHSAGIHYSAAPSIEVYVTPMQKAGGRLTQIATFTPTQVTILPATPSSSTTTGALTVRSLGIDGATYTKTLNVAAHTPAKANDIGVAGTITWDSNYIYICTAENTWKRVAIESW